MKQLHINNCAFPLLPGDMRVLRKYLSGAEFVKTLSGCNDHYWAESEKQRQQLKVSLDSVDPASLSPIPYKRGRDIMPWLEADLFQMLQKAVDPATAR